MKITTFYLNIQFSVCQKVTQPTNLHRMIVNIKIKFHGNIHSIMSKYRIVQLQLASCVDFSQCARLGKEKKVSLSIFIA